MKKIMILISLLNFSFLFSQELTKKETIAYINQNLEKTQISIDSQGIVTLKDIAIFYYKDIKLGGYPFHPFQIQFHCKIQNECIEDPKYNPEYGYPKKKYKNLARIFLDDKENYTSLYNAFDYLFKLLKTENLSKENNDPFSSQNYNKN